VLPEVAAPFTAARFSGVTGDLVAPCS